MYSTADESSEDFLDTAVNNGHAFSQLLNKYPDFDTYLAREDDHLIIRPVSTDYDEQEQILTIDYDIDGIFIEWNSFNGISHPIRHLQILPKDIISLKQIWPLVKKHLDLRKYSEVELKQLKTCLGSQLFYEFGWEYWIGLIPEKPCIEMDDHSVRMYTFTTLRSVRQEFKNRLQNASKGGSVTNTLVKNNLSDVKKLSILPDDSCEIMNILQQAIDAVQNPPGMRKILFSFRFGEKCSRPTDLPVSDALCVSDISAHIAMEIAADDDIDIFWSRYGLQEITGTRGLLTTCMSFAECANFQSNLDGRDLDIKPALRRVCKYPERLRFVQLYADLPHRYPKTRYHPVSGSIIISKALHYETVKSFQNDSAVYLSEMENNFNLITKCKCRLEMVLSIPDHTVILDARDYFSSNNLEALLKNHSLFVPFWCKTGYFCSALREIGLHIVSSLKTLYRKHKLSGNCSGVWCSYQLELALEKLLWGHPLCILSQQYSINLGPGAGFPSRSKTDEFGFLALESEFSAIENEQETPPINIYSKSEVIQKQIKKMYSFDDYFESSLVVLGRRALYILLQDLFDIGNVAGSFTNFFLNLKRGNGLSPSLVVGSVTGKQLSDIVGTAEKMRYPMVFKEVLARLSTKKQKLVDLFEVGLRELDLEFFRALRIWDVNRNKVLNWKDSFKYWKVQPANTIGSKLEEYTSVLTPLVITELENQKLVYATKFRDQRFRREPFPWIKPCLCKLDNIRLKESQLISCLTFISCLALKKNDWFVDYIRLSRLVETLPLSQSALKGLEIQSKYLLPGFSVCKIWRLHPTIPFKLQSDTQRLKTLEDPNVQDVGESVSIPETVVNRIDPEDITLKTQTVDTMQMMHHPANCKSTWMPEELEVVQTIKDTYKHLSERDRYNRYQILCRERNIRDRTFTAFISKYKRTPQIVK